MSLTYEPGRAALLAARGGASRSCGRSPIACSSCPRSTSTTRRRARAALHHLERRLFEPDAAQRDRSRRAVRCSRRGASAPRPSWSPAEVLELLRAGVPGGEIVVVCRSPARSAALAASPCSPTTASRSATSGESPLGHTPLGRGLLALARCALLDDSEQARAGDLLDYLRTPGVLDLPELADALEADVRREGLRAPPRPASGSDFPARGDRLALRAAEDPAARSWPGTRGGCSPRAHRGGAPVLDAAEELDARAVAALAARSSELRELGEQLSRAGVARAARGPRGTGRAPHPGTRRGAHRRPARDPRPALSRSCSCAGCRRRSFPLAGVARAVSLRRAPPGARAQPPGSCWRASDEALARERYLFYACVSRADRAARAELPQLRRGWQPRARLAVPRRRRRPARRRLARAPRASTARRRRLASSTRHRRRASALAPPPRRARRRTGAGRRDAGPRAGRALGGCATCEVLSAGALENYADCPVKWLVERELAPGRAGARVRGDRARQLHARRARAAVARARRRGDAADAGRRRADPRRRAGRAAPTMFDAGGGSLAPGRSEGVRAATLRQIEADLRRYLAPRGGRRLRLAARGARAPVRLRADAARVRCRPLVLGEGPERFLRGVIDRVDVDPRRAGRAIVRDYKSGSARPERAGGAVASDRELQVALYMIAVRQLLELEPVAGFYQPLGGGDLRPRGVFWRGRRSGLEWSATMLVSASSSTPSWRMRSSAGGGARPAAARRRARALARDVLARRLPVPGHLLEPTVSVVSEPPQASSDGRARWTDEQRLAIERRAGDLLLVAGAGSGKTSVLVERFVRAVRRGRRRRRGDPRDHVHREGGRRAERSRSGRACGSSARATAPGRPRPP